ARIPRFPSSRDRVAIIGAVAACRNELAQALGATVSAWKSGRRYGPISGAALPKAHFLDLQPGDSIDDMAQKLAAVGHIDHIVWIAPHELLQSLAEDHIIEAQERGVLLVFRAVKALLALGYGTRDLGWTVLTVRTQPIHRHDAVHPTHASLHGLIGSMAKEYASWKVRLIDVEHLVDLDWDRIFTLPTDPRGNAR